MSWKNSTAPSRLTGRCRVGRRRGGQVPPTPFPPAALRTGRARYRASGSPRGPQGSIERQAQLQGLQVGRLVRMPTGEGAHGSEVVRVHPGKQDPLTAGAVAFPPSPSALGTV